MLIILVVLSHYLCLGGGRRGSVFEVLQQISSLLNLSKQILQKLVLVKSHSVVLAQSTLSVRANEA